MLWLVVLWPLKQRRAFHWYKTNHATEATWSAGSLVMLQLSCLLAFLSYCMLFYNLLTELLEVWKEIGCLTKICMVVFELRNVLPHFLVQRCQQQQLKTAWLWQFQPTQNTRISERTNAKAALDATSPVTAQVDMRLWAQTQELQDATTDTSAGKGGRDPPCLSLNSSFICLINLRDGVL